MGMHEHMHTLYAVHVHVTVHHNMITVCVHMHIHMNKSGGPEQARQTVDSCFELVGPHQRRVCTSCSGHTGFMYPKVSLLIVVSGIHPPQTAELHLREKPHLKNLMPQYREEPG